MKVTELLEFTCSGLGNNQDSRLSYQNDKQHPSEGSSTIIQYGHDSGFPRIQLGIGHSDCCVCSLNALLLVPLRKIFRPQTRKFAAMALLSSFYCLRTH